MIRGEWPRDISAVADRLYVCTVDGRAIVYSQTSGSILTEYTTVQDNSKACSITQSAQLSLAVVLWNQNQIIFYLLSENKSFLTVNVESGVSRIRISDQGRIVTGNGGTGEVKIYDLFSNFITYDHVKQTWINMLRKADCERLTDYFCLPKDQTDSILKSVTPIRNLLLALEERGTIYPSNVSSLIEAFVTLQMSETYYRAANIYQEKARATSYDRFLVTLAAHLTSSLPGDLCDYFKISDEKKNSITSDKNPGLSLLLALDEMGILNQSSVGALKQPFTNLKLVQAVAKIQEYQSVVEDEKDSYQHTMSLTKEGTRNIFVKLLKKKIKSWYESMTPVPWKRSCRWKSSELFVGSGLILTNSKTQRSVVDVDEQRKLDYTNIFSHDSLKEETRIIIEGEPGSGKTMLSSQLAYDWSEGKITDVNIFILLPLKLVETKTLLEATKDFYQTEGKGLSLTDMEDVITDEGVGCCFLLDGLEEYNGKNDTSSEEPSEVMKVMTKAKYPNCKVIITSRSDFAQDLPPCPMLKLGGFSEEQRDGYIENVFFDEYEKQMEVKKIIEDTPFILDLCTVPLLFVLAVHNIGDMESVHDIQKEKVAPFIGKMVVTLCNEDFDDNWDYVSGRDLEGDLLESNQNESQGISLERLAFNGLCKGKQQLSWQKRFIEENVRDGKQYLDSGILVVEEAVNVGKEGDTTLGDITDKTKREVSEEAKQESQKDKVDNVIVAKETRAVNQTSDVSSTTESTINVESQSTEDLKSPLTLQHVSLQVKFLHKIIQEWFAARHLANICWKYGELSLPNRYIILREHLQQINPADLHYVLRFTCALCPPSCHCILNYLISAFRSKEGVIPDHIMNCICLCLAEYDGYKGHFIKDVISEVCKADITIRSEDSRLLQRAKVSMLQFASKCRFSISRLQLPDAIVEATEDELTFNSGATLKVLNTLKKIEMSRWDQMLEEKDYANILKFVINSASVEEASLFFPSQPPILQPDDLKEIASKEVTVDWHIGQLVQTLDLSKGMWTMNRNLQLRRKEDKKEGSLEMLQDCYVKANIKEESQLIESDPDVQSLFQASAIITKTGGILEVPNTGVVLIIPPNALPEHMEQCEMHMRIIPRELIKEKIKSFSSNSSTVVELLPDSLRFQRSVRLTLPHCLVLQRTRERKARIFFSHHTTGCPPQWEEHTNLSYHLEDTACIILLDRFCWLKYSINDEIVEAKKLVVYTAARRLLPQDKVAEIQVGYYTDLPGKKKIQNNPDLIVAHKKTFYYLNRKEQHSLRVSLDDIFPFGWECLSTDARSRDIQYYQIVHSSSYSCSYILEKKSSKAGNPLCVFTISQENGQIAVQLAVHLKVMDKDVLPARNMDPTNKCLEQYEAHPKEEMTITKLGGTLEISETGVKLEILPDALPAEIDQCVIHMSIIPSRVVEDQVTSLCSNSSTAVEIVSNNLTLQSPAKLTLPHCLTFNESEERSARIFINEEKGSPAPWQEQRHMLYKLEDSACIIYLDKLCCVQYSIDDKIVTAKKIMVYTAVKAVEQKDKLAEVEVGYYSDIPVGRELLGLNPNLWPNSPHTLLYMRQQKFPLQLSLDGIFPSQWTCCAPKPIEKPQEIPFKVIASSIEHSYLYVLQKENNQSGSTLCRFTALQRDGLMPIQLSLRICPQEDKPDFTAKIKQKQTNTDHLNVAFQYLSKKLGPEWESVGRELGLEDADLYRIKEDNRVIQETIHGMLVCWKQKKGSQATYLTLITSLEKAGRKDLAEKVQNLEGTDSDFNMQCTDAPTSSLHLNPAPNLL